MEAREKKSAKEKEEGELKAERDTLKNKITDKKAQVAEKAAEEAQHKEYNIKKEIDNQNITDDIDGMKQTLHTVNSKRDMVEQDLKKIQKSLKSEKIKFDEKKEKKQRHVTENTDLRQQVKHLEGLEKKASQNERKIKEEKLEVDLEKARIKDSYDKAMTQHKHKKMQVNEEKKEIEQKKRERDLLNKAVATAEEDYREKSAKDAQLENEKMKKKNQIQMY